MKTINKYIIEKLKIGKSTVNKEKANIEIDIDFSAWEILRPSETFDRYFSKDDVNDIIEFAENLKIPPIKISNKYRKSVYTRLVGLYFSKDDKNRIIINCISEQIYEIVLIINNSQIDKKRYEMMKLNDALESLLDVLDKNKYFDKL